MIRLSANLLFLCLIAVAQAGATGQGDQRLPMAVVVELLRAAEPGAVVLVPPGIYEGNLRIQKAVTLDGRGRAVFDGMGKGTVVEIASADVCVRGFTIRGSGDDVPSDPAAIRAIAGPVVIEEIIVEDSLFGIDLRESPGSIIRNNLISGKDLNLGRRGDGIRLWWSHNCVVEDNTITGSRDMVFWYSENLRISRNRVTDSRYGLHFMYSHDTVLAGNILSGNSVGIYLMYSNRITLTDNFIRNNRGASGYGVGLKDCDDIVIKNNAFLANRVGIYIDNSPSSVDSTGIFESNMIAFNEIGILATPNTHDNVFTRNALIENETPAATHGRGQLTNNAFSRDGVGNFWSDYAGFDRDGDGIGDLKYEPRSLFGAMLAREPNLRIFVHSPAQQAIEFTARALPELLPSATLVDPAPLAIPPKLSITDEQATTGPRAMAATGLGMLTVAAAAAVMFSRQPALGSKVGETAR